MHSAATKEERYAKDEGHWSSLMRRANAGDADAYSLLLTELASAIEAYLLARFGQLDDLEDCVQEALLAVHRARQTYDPRRKFRPWMFTIVRHKTIDAFRKAEVRGRGRSEYREETTEGPSPDTEGRVDGSNLMMRLEPHYREALELTKLAGFTVPEAAQQSGITTAAMKTRVHRGLRLIRQMLSQEEPGRTGRSKS